MKNNKLELSLIPVSALSPSIFYDMKSCRLKGILSANHLPPLLPLSPTIRLGTAIHILFEQVFKGMITNRDELLQIWTNIIHKIESEMLENCLESHLVPLELSAKHYEVKKMIAFNAVQDLISNNKTHLKNINFESEKYLKTDDGKIKGRIDLIRKKENYIEIIDFKTGEILDENLDDPIPKKGYEIQLKMYAALFYSVHKVWPNKLILEGLNRHCYEIPFEHQECLSMLDNAKKELDEINTLIENDYFPEDFAQPSPDSCKYCVYRPACNKYWNDHLYDNNWPPDVRGDLKQKKLLGNGYYKIVILDDTKEINIRGLSGRHSFLIEDVQKILLCNLGRDTSINNYIEMPLTTGYVLPS